MFVQKKGYSCRDFKGRQCGSTFSLWCHNGFATMLFFYKKIYFFNTYMKNYKAEYNNNSLIDDVYPFFDIGVV